MDSAAQIVVALVIAVVAAVVGSTYQVERRRSRPFILLKSFEGDSIRNETEVEVAPGITERVKAAAYIARPEKPRLEHVRRTFNSAARVERSGPELLRRLDIFSIEALKNARDDEAALTAIVDPLTRTYFDDFVLTSLLRGRLRLPVPTGGQETKVEVYEVDDDGGSFQVGFPGQPLRLGFQLQKAPLARGQLKNLADSIATLERACVLESFERIAALLRTEMEIAAAVAPPLEQIGNQYARWFASVYLANYGETAMLVLPAAELAVRKRLFERQLTEDCHLVVRSRDEDGGFVAEANGLIISPGTNADLAFITDREQRQMKEGHEMRGRFDDGVSRGRVQFQVVSVGFLRSRRKVSSPWVPFRAPS